MPTTPELSALAQRLLRAYPGRRDEALAVLNGALGDALAARGSSLALDMSLSYGPQRLALEDPPLAVPDGRSRVCLFVHGLMGSELAWRFGVPNSAPAETPAAQASPRVEYGPKLVERFELSDLYVRYNTGRHISQNGRELADKLERLHAAWPFTELSIVAHSMGGLVTRSACHYALEAGHGWVQTLERVFLLGVPSRGAPLEFWAHLTAFTLEQIWNPWTKLIARAINLRSAGIKDLRHGFVLDEDWRHYDADRLAYPVPLAPRVPTHARFYVAHGTLGEPGSSWSSFVGDGLVRSRSAQGASLDPRERESLPPAEVAHFPRTGHMALMNDAAVLAQINEWWTTS